MLVRLAAIIAAGFTAAGAAGAPTPPPENGRIAFASITYVILMNPDGSGMWPARWGPTDAVDSWSPDGMRLLVDFASDVYAVDPDGGRRTQLTFSPAWDGHAAWSPDGTRIAFESSRDGFVRIWVMNADGTGAHTITENFANARTPTWSPDSKQIAFEDGDAIWITSADGVGARRIAGEIPTAHDPAWSPDGTAILFSGSRGADLDIYSAPIDGGPVTRLTTHPADDTAPVWSPDGIRIAFASTRTGSNELWQMARDGSSLAQLTFGGVGIFGKPAWQPVGPRPSGCSIWGTPGPDLLVGGTGREVICGLGGDDRILGGEGHDILYGNSGDDVIIGGPGADLIDAGPGNDIVDTRDRDPDVVNAGTGEDSALVDRGLDRVRNVDRGSYPEPDNLARGRPVRASLALPTGPAAYAVDGHRTAFWASYYAPQWIEIDLGIPQTIGRVGLVVAQTPEGTTDHVILGRASVNDRWRGLADLKGITHDKQLVSYTPRRPWRNVRYIRIETRASPSWVAWKEIAVFRAR